MDLRHLILNDSTLRWSALRRVQDSAPYVAIGRIRALYNIFTLRDLEMSWFDQIVLLSLPNDHAANLVRR